MEVITEHIHRNDSATFTAFLAMLHQMIPPHLHTHLIMDNGSSRTSHASRAWLAPHPGFAVTYTPKHASWLNMVEPWLGVLTRWMLRRGEFASRDDLEVQDHRVHHQPQLKKAVSQSQLPYCATYGPRLAARPGEGLKSPRHCSPRPVRSRECSRCGSP
jgi:transposase